MSGTIREVVAVFDDTAALDAAVFDLETRGLDRAAFTVLASEAAVEDKLGARYRRVAEMEDKPNVPRETFFLRASRLEAEYLPSVALASIGAVIFSGGAALPALIAAGSGALIGAALGGLIHHHHATLVAEQLARGGLLLWVNVRDAAQEATALEVLRMHSAHDVHAHTLPA